MGVGGGLIKRFDHFLRAAISAVKFEFKILKRLGNWEQSQFMLQQCQLACVHKKILYMKYA